MSQKPLAIINLKQEATTDANYKNAVLSVVNDHVVKISVMTEDFYWHYHPNSDETFLVTEGGLMIDLEDKTVEVNAGELFTIPKNTIHRTRPMGKRSVNLTFELVGIETVKVEI